jgi:hypothetical protein
LGARGESREGGVTTATGFGITPRASLISRQRPGSSWWARLSGLLRLGWAPRRLTTAGSRRPEQLLVRPDTVQNDRAPTDSIDEQKVASQMALGKATPFFAPPPQTVLAKCRWESIAGDQDVENMLESFDVEFGVLTSVSVVALEAREND